MILLIDNYDSFTYNLYQYIGVFCDDIKVVRNDKITIEEIKELQPEKIILSPGPKSPKEAGICMEVVKEFYDKVPMLGICLGHQCIGEAFGGIVSYAKALFHGKQSEITHDGTGLFEGIDSPIKVARYHSLAVQQEGQPLQMMERSWQCSIKNIRYTAYSFIRNPFIPNMENGSLIILYQIQKAGVKIQR